MSFKSPETEEQLLYYLSLNSSQGYQYDLLAPFYKNHWKYILPNSFLDNNLNILNFQAIVPFLNGEQILKYIDKKDIHFQDVNISCLSLPVIKEIIINDRYPIQIYDYEHPLIIEYVFKYAGSIDVSLYPDHNLDIHIKKNIKRIDTISGLQYVTLDKSFVKKHINKFEQEFNHSFIKEDLQILFVQNKKINSDCIVNKTQELINYLKLEAL